MIFDRWGNPLGDLPYAIKAVRTRATDGTDTLDITTIGEINKDERIVFKDSMGRWAEYLCQSTQTARAAGMPVTVAYCTGSIAELSRTYIEDKRNRNANAKACLAKALEGTRWAVGTVETGTITGTANLAFYHCTVLEAVQKTADTYGLEVQTEYQPDPTGNRIGRRIIHLVEHRGTANTTKRFEYGKDLTQIKRDIDSGDVITRLYGWGKGIEQTNDQGEATGGYSHKISFADVNNGKPYVQDDQALANWGIVGADGTRHHSEASVDFPDCEDPKELLTLTKNALKTRATPVVSYTADVTALGQAGLSAEGTDVGDSVQIIDTSFTTPLRLEGRILQIEEDLAGSLADTKITLGNIRQSYTQRLAAQQQALDKLVSSSGAWNSAAGGTGPYMKDLIDRINQIMNATGGYTYLKPGQGIYVYDKPEDQNPTQAIQIGGGFWRIADKKKPNGDWDFRSLANGHGIFADTLFTGMLHDAAGYNYWNLDTGEFSLSARSTIGGSTLDSHLSDTLGEAKTDAATKANSALSSAKTYADTGDSKTLASAKTFATSEAESHVNTLDKELTQLEIFNRLTNNGKTQGIYMKDGLLYINGTYLRTGVITGLRSYWNLDTGQFVMTDANGRRTVLLDGDGNSNLLTGTFQTALSGSSVRISPTFSQTEIGGGDEITGPGIQFYHATASNQHPYIAVESSTKQEGEVSALTFNGGHRGKDDPGGWLRIGERKDSNNTTKIATALMMAKANYRSTTSAGSSVSLKSSSGKCNATMMAYDSNGSVGVEADIFTGYLYLGGFLGSWAGQRGTLITHEVEGSHHIAPFMTTTFRLMFTPPKYGRYKGLGTVNCADQNASISSTPCNETSSEYTVMIRSMPASVGGYSLFPSGGTNYWVTGFAYLVK
ncbi:phage tail spike protein [Bifidobacterium bifidum]|uniref:phage tail spike protein n=1 Tax=Bifidobacterium bifidum TaxID=1681 RepID=UPI00388D28DF